MKKITYILLTLFTFLLHFQIISADDDTYYSDCLTKSKKTCNGDCIWITNSSESGFCKMNCSKENSAFFCSRFSECTWTNEGCKENISISNSNNYFGYSDDVSCKFGMTKVCSVKGYEDLGEFGINSAYYETSDTSDGFAKQIIVRKSEFEEIEDSNYQMSVVANLTNKKGEFTNVVLFVTTLDDIVPKVNGIWWGSLLACKNVEFSSLRGKIGDFFISNEGDYETYVVTTDDISAYKDPKRSSGLIGLKDTKDSSADCRVYTPVGIDKKNYRYVCPFIDEREGKIETLLKKYKENPNSEYITEYKAVLEEIKTSCTSILDHSDYNEACMNHCLNLSKSITRWNYGFDLSNFNNSCGFSEKLINWILNILKWIKYIIPVAVIVLGMIDFIKATASDKDDEMKKAQGRSIKRLIAAALIFLVPLLVEFILPKLGFDYNSCGLF